MVAGGAGKVWIVLACVLAFSSCVRQVQTLAHSASRPAVSTVMARQVENAVDMGEGDLEIRALRRRLAASAADLDARMLLAQLYSRRGFPDLALEHYRLASTQYPESIVVTLALAKTLRKMGESGEALNAVKSGLEKHPAGSWELLSLEGIIEDELGQLGPAETAYRGALTLEPGRSSLHNNLGYNLLLQGRPDAAVPEFRRAIEIDPRSPIAHNNLGVALAAQSQRAPGEALTEWQQSADRAVAHNNLAVVLMEQGHYADARAELETALGFRPNFPVALANLKLAAERDGQPVTIRARKTGTHLKRAASTSDKIHTTKRADAAGIAAPEHAGAAEIHDAPSKGGKDNSSY